MSRKTLYLHIGRHKTGTSSIQTFMAGATDGLEAANAIYPQTGRQREGMLGQLAHHECVRCLQTGTAADIDAMGADLAREVAPYETVILSSEAFQNLTPQQLPALTRLLAPYDVTVVCYLREGLVYALSSYAQRIHAKDETHTLRDFVMRHSVSPGAFIKRWQAIGAQNVFRLYDRSVLKDGDVVADFLSILGLEALQTDAPELSSNPSLSGNLLSLKLLMNAMGQAKLAPYIAYGEAAKLDPSFRGRIYVSDRVAEELRGLTPYNDELATHFPNVAKPSFEGGSRLFDFTRWDADMDLIATVPELAFAKMIRLGTFGAIVEDHGFDTDPTQTGFLPIDMSERIVLPETSRIRHIRERSKQALQDAAKARKEARQAQTRAVRAEAERDRLAQRIAEMETRLKS